MSRKEHRNAILVIEAGSTKTLLYYRQNNDKQHYIDIGYNPLHHNYDQLEAILYKVKYLKPIRVEFYGAGCVDASICHNVNMIIRTIWPDAKVMVGSDLLAAAKACFANTAGVVAILGTGSASGFFDGHTFSKRIPSGGYLLGDLGSGFELGKSIAYSWLLGEFEPEIIQLLEQYCGMDAVEFRKEVYFSHRPVSRVADLAKFAAKYKSDTQISNLISLNFNIFIERILLKYDDIFHTPIGFCGGIAYYFKNELIQCLNAHGITDIRIIKQAGDHMIDKPFDDFII